MLGDLFVFIYTMFSTNLLVNPVGSSSESLGLKFLIFSEKVKKEFIGIIFNHLRMTHNSIIWYTYTCVFHVYIISHYYYCCESPQHDSLPITTGKTRQPNSELAFEFLLRIIFRILWMIFIILRIIFMIIKLFLMIIFIFWELLLSFRGLFSVF